MSEFYKAASNRTAITPIFALIAVVFLMFGNVQARSEACVTSGSTQYFEVMKVCASTVLPAQGRNHYGPQQLSNRRGAWCEGAAGDGVGATIRFEFEEAESPVMFHFQNGYAKSNKVYLNNGRVAALRMRDDMGNETIIEVEDDSRPIGIRVPWDRDAVRWYEFTVLSIYPGRKYHDTCISMLRPDFERY